MQWRNEASIKTQKGQGSESLWTDEYVEGQE